MTRLCSICIFTIHDVYYMCNTIHIIRVYIYTLQYIFTYIVSLLYRFYRRQAGRVSGSIGGKISICDNEHNTRKAMCYTTKSVYTTKSIYILQYLIPSKPPSLHYDNSPHHPMLKILTPLAQKVAPHIVGLGVDSQIHIIC